MKITVRGKGDVNLSKNDYVTEGGEGQIFAKGNTVYKIYTDLAKMIPESKVSELHALDSKKHIIIPKDIVLNDKGKVVGFTMDKVDSSVTLCQLFNTAFWSRNGITADMIQKIVEGMMEDIEFVHSKNCLIVDVNELNFLVEDKKYQLAYFIDTNSYKTPSFPPTAIMPSVRDWRSKDFTKLTDWFSFSVLAFQLFTGIHPFKGKHPDYKTADMVQRMKDGVSVFDSKVSVPKAMRDLSNIPSEYLKWFKKLYVDGDRLPPPAVAGLLNVMHVAVTLIDSTNNFVITFEKDYDSDILAYKVFGGMKIALTKKNLFIDKLDYQVPKKASVIVSPKTMKPIMATIEDGYLKMTDIRTNAELQGSKMFATEKLVVDNTLYIRYNGYLTQIVLIDMPDKIMYSAKKVCDVMPNSTQVYSGVLYENVLGKAYLIMPVPSKDICVTQAVPEMDGYRIVEAKHDNRVVVVIGHKDNAYHRFVLRFDEEYKKYDCQIVSDVDSFINFVVLENGVAIFINEDGVLEMMANRPSSSKATVIKDPDINTGMTLTKRGQDVLFYKGKSLYRLAMKK